MDRNSFLLVVLLGILPASWGRWISSKMGWETTRGGGMYYTPSTLINRILVCDPACGTGGFLVTARDRVVGGQG